VLHLIERLLSDFFFPTQSFVNGMSVISDWHTSCVQTANKFDNLTSKKIWALAGLVSMAERIMREPGSTVEGSMRSTRTGGLVLRYIAERKL
jgi:hypothetical protein